MIRRILIQLHFILCVLDEGLRRSLVFCKPRPALMLHCCEHVHGGDVGMHVFQVDNNHLADQQRGN